MFGEYYRTEVLGDMEGEGHQNIRGLMEGFEAVTFQEGLALEEKN